MLVCSFLKTHIGSDYCDFHVNESDMKICNVPLSQKKINGPSILALNWSKNKKKKAQTDSTKEAVENTIDEIYTKKENFSSHLMIINLKSARWWKNLPRVKLAGCKITYNDPFRGPREFIL